jgi:multicomponent Na+:H+ antiporter subunit D
MGAIMAVYGVIYAFIENDIRRLLSYHIISQVGYMVCGVGLGSPMAVNGSSAHAFCHILYKALLFMGAGAVIHVTGKRKITELMGRDLYRRMPWTLLFYMVGAFSISAVPLFNGFISKNMVVYAAGELQRPGVELLLHLASVGTFLSVGLKLPWGTWFGKRTEREDTIPAHEPPFNMLLAMGLTSFLCILTGIAPGLLYAVLPYPVDFHPYSPDKVVFALQLLLMTGAAFWFYLPRLKVESTISLDTDWFYRMFGKGLLWFCNRPLNALRSEIQDSLGRAVMRINHLSGHPYRLPRWIGSLLSGGGREKHKTIWSEYDSANSPKLPIGVAVAMSVVFLFVFSLIYFFAAE